MQSCGHSECQQFRLQRFSVSAHQLVPMSTMNISLPEALVIFVDEQVEERGYGNRAEYVRELIRKERDRQHLRGLLLAGAESAPTQPADASFFQGLRARVRSP